MTLPKENLDTRTYEDLVKEAVSRIPVYAPEWTDHNVHDPGRTFIELFAWLAEMQIYNLNRITDRSRRKFLKLMGIPELRPAKAATVDVTFSLVTRYLFCWDDIPGNDDLRLREFLKQNFAIDWVETAKIEKIDNIKTIKLSYQKNYLSLKLNDEQTEVNLEIDDIRTDKFVVKIEKSKLNIYLTGTPTCIDRGTIVAASDTVSGEDVLFETQQDLMVINAELTKILVRPRDLNYFDRSEANKNENVYFYAFRSRPEVGDELYLGFDNDPGKDITLALHLLKDGLAEIESKLFPSGKVKWEYWDGSDWQRVEELFSWDDPENDKKRLIDFLKQDYSIDWIETAKIEKIDNGKTIKISYQKNSLLLKLNDEQTKVNLEIDDVRTDKISVKIENGKLYKELIDKTHHLSTSGTIKISIAGQMAKKNVEDHDRYWLRCVVEDGTYDIPPKIDQIRLNTVDAVQRSKEKQDRFSGSGLPDFCIDIKDVPVLDAMKDEGTPTPQITVDNDQLPWKKVEDFDASKSGDEHYTMDLKSGRICFGDGIHGKIPPEGKDNILISYRTGGGVRGNVNAGAINRVDDDLAARISVTNYRPASGGEDAETLEEAIQRARKDLKTPYRAVTSQDYERLAINTPGVRVARARALPGYYPGKNSPVAGIVSVIVVPKVEDGTVNPELSQGFLKTVYEHLDKRRLLTTELVVLRPGYEEITVEATVRIHPRFVGSAVADEVKKKLNDFLHPIRGGPDGTGWPFGRTVYRSEIYEVIDRVEGVDHVRSVSLARNGTRSSDDIAILPHSLVYSGSHRIEVQEIKEGVDD